MAERIDGKEIKSIKEFNKFIPWKKGKSVSEKENRKGVH